MTKEDLILLFKNYNENKSKLELRQREKKVIERRLEGEREIETSITNSYGLNNDIRSKNSISDKVCNAVLKEQTKIEEDKARLKELEKIISRLQDKLDEVEIRLRGLKYKERFIVQLNLIEGRTYDDIAYNVCYDKFGRTYSVRNLQEIQKVAIEKMLKM